MGGFLTPAVFSWSIRERSLALSAVFARFDPSGGFGVA
jgi:hypothetical protein